jgi:hypothetical protein
MQLVVFPRLLIEKMHNDKNVTNCLLGMNAPIVQLKKRSNSGNWW